MASKTQRNAPAAPEPTEPELDDFDTVGSFIPEGFDTEQTGFAPWWQPAVGKSFYARVMGFDFEGEFTRIILEAKRPVNCYRGPSEDAEKILVKEGEFFSMSIYKGLPLHQYVDEDVLVRVRGEQDLKGKSSRTLWLWDLLVSPDTKKRVQQRKMILLKEAQERAALAAKAEREAVDAAAAKTNGEKPRQPTITVDAAPVR